jgi:hypothetical protein
MPRNIIKGGGTGKLTTKKRYLYSYWDSIITEYKWFEILFIWNQCSRKSIISG